MRRTTLLALVVALVTPTIARAEGDPVPAVVAGPGGYLVGYATPVAVTTVGGPLWFVNGDLPTHDVVADDTIDGESVFASRLIGIGQHARVEGLERTESGKAYGFHCTLHPNMTGILVVV